MSLSQCDRELSCGQVLSVLMPHLAGLVVEGVAVAGERVFVRARPAAGQVPCPGCGVLSGKRHDGYARSLRDLPVWGRQVVVRLQVRVLCCVNPGCARKTFAEQVGGLTSAWSRRTPLLAGALEAVAKVLAGRAGSALAGQLGMPASRHSMIRLVLALPEEDLVTAPRVLGIDDFAFRRGRAYGTVLIDMETGQVIGVLPDRETGTVKKWLEDHPGAAVICRDRAAGYGSACSQGAPDAIQVADRWHLLHNLSDRVRQAAAAALAGHQHEDHGEQPGEQREAPPPPPPGPPPATPEPRRAAEIRRLHAEIRRLRDAGYSKTATARELGICVPTVRKYAAAATAAELIPARQPSAADPYKDHLIRRWNDGARDARALAAEITQLGYQGSDQQVRRYLQPLRNLPGNAPPQPPPLPAARDIARWISTSPASLTAEDTAALAAVTAKIPRIAVITGLARSFADITAGLTATLINPATGKETLETWLQAAESAGFPPLATFAAGIRQDYDAVRNGLSLPWNSGKVEGTVSKLKKIKRQVYGRASFTLLRKLLLAANHQT
ncbi:MAG TPA: ISL3 family transposase [Streptosporangiaceae bacterium]|nr:ISL3 family transposase [Streptosporangiaceae bacterium]